MRPRPSARNCTYDADGAWVCAARQGLSRCAQERCWRRHVRALVRAAIYDLIDEPGNQRRERPFGANRAVPNSQFWSLEQMSSLACRCEQIGGSARGYQGVPRIRQSRPRPRALVTSPHVYASCARRECAHLPLLVRVGGRLMWPPTDVRRSARAPASFRADRASPADDGAVVVGCSLDASGMASRGHAVIGELR